MIYADSVKQKMDTIFKAFKGYIDSQDYFDIVYSNKIGYFRILVHDLIDFAPDVLDTPETMLETLFNDIINDVVYSPGNPAKNHEHLRLTEYEKTEGCRRIAAILKTMEDGGAAYLPLLDRYLKNYQERYAREDKLC